MLSKCAVWRVWKEREKEGVYAIALKQYRFRLQTVLDVRTDELELVQQRVATEERKCLEITQRITEYDQMLEQAFIQQQQRLNEPELDIVQAREFPNFIWRLKQFRFEEHRNLEQQEKVLSEVREALRQAMIRKKSLEVLKEKDQKKFYKQIDKLEEEFLSEMALNRYQRQKQIS